MSRYICTVCGFIYDEADGIPGAGIAPGTRFDDLPDDWVCPLCGSPKSEFALMEEEEKGPAPAAEPAAPEARAARPAAPAAAVAASVPAGDGDDRMREMSFGEMADLCSNLQRGCEKQYLEEEAGLFGRLAGYYRERAEPAAPATDADLLALIEANLQGYGEAEEAAEAAGDRGAKRVLTWSGKVMRILRSLVDRYGEVCGKLVGGTNVYVCDICGFVYVGEEPPAICPICKVPSLKLLKVERRE